MAKKTDWEERAANLLKAELTLRGISYEQLRIELEKIGIKKKYNNLAKMINAGAFSFAFFLQCAAALGFDTLQIRYPTNNDAQQGGVEE